MESDCDNDHYEIGMYDAMFGHMCKFVPTRMRGLVTEFKHLEHWTDSQREEYYRGFCDGCK